MQDEQLPSAVNISKRYTALISLVLGAIGYFVLPFLQSKGFLAFLPALSGLDEYAAFYHLFGAAVGLLMPSIIAIIWRGLNLLRPRPGAKAFDEDDRQEMKKAFEIDRRMLSIAMVPSHPATAKAAKNSAHLELGDATLVLPKRSQILLKKFVGAPRSRSRAKKQLTAALQKDILIVTGEPGAGKSVLVQELHSTLSKGVEEGSHSLVPFIVLARDLTLELLREARGSDSPMSTFLKRYYERRLAVATDAGLVKLYNLVAERWQNLDAIVIVDALDEIAQRSKYEEIQRILSEMILSDLKHGGKCVHRYVLSCRVDEDLGIFPNAYSIVLRGLSDAERNRFCESLISRSGLDREGMRMLQEVIDMGRVSPSHVFRRNPYFLSLLLRHLRDDEDRVKDQVIDFDLLMRKYLEREAGRPYALIGKRQSVTAEERRALFNELEKISRSSLQYLAYCSASTNKIGALYDETELNFKLLAGFSSEINSPLPEQLSAGPWKDLHLLLEVLANQERTSAITNAQLHELDLSSCLHENDIRLLDSLSLQLQSVGNGEALVFSAMGTIPYRSSIETAAWYRKLAELFARLVPWEETDKHARLAFLLFLRGIVAAHALRIVVINLTDQSITVRLRHRRLAEYYAASYIRNCWNVVPVSLRFSPWLAPVLNLTCAIEGPKCSALSWLVARVGDAPWRPFYEWRNAVEAAVEAAFFSHPSSEYARAVSRLTATIVTTLQTRGSRVRVQSSSISSRSKHMPTYAAADAIDPVTEIVLLRSLESIGRLDKVLKGPVIREGVRLGFSSYVECLPIEWLAAILRPRDAVERLAGKVFSLRSTILIIRRLIRKPGSVFSSYGGGRRRSEWKFLIPITLATILGETAMLSVSTAVVAGLFYLIVGRLAGSGPEIHTATIVIATIAGASFLIVRSLAWLRSPIRAAEWSPWDKLPRVVQQLWRLYRTASRELPLVVRGWRSTRKRALSLHAKLIFRKFLFGIG